MSTAEFRISANLLVADFRGKNCLPVIWRSRYRKTALLQFLGKRHQVFDHGGDQYYRRSGNHRLDGPFGLQDWNVTLAKSQDGSDGLRGAQVRCQAQAHDLSRAGRYLLVLQDRPQSCKLLP